MNEKLKTQSYFCHRFSVLSKQNGKTIGTGIFRTSKKMNKDEQIRFLHQYTNGIYLKKEDFVDIYVFESEA